MATRDWKPPREPWPADFPDDEDSPPAMRSEVGTDRDGATLRVDSVVEVEGMLDDDGVGVVAIARVLSCERDLLTVAFAGHIVSDTIDRARARRIWE